MTFIFSKERDIDCSCLGSFTSKKQAKTEKNMLTKQPG
jgi:hypothetical protein